VKADVLQVWDSGLKKDQVISAFDNCEIPDALKVKKEI